MHTDGISCEQRKTWQNCYENWMISGGYCQATCGRCPVSQAVQASVVFDGPLFDPGPPLNLEGNEEGKPVLPTGVTCKDEEVAKLPVCESANAAAVLQSNLWVAAANRSLCTTNGINTSDVMVPCFLGGMSGAPAAGMEGGTPLQTYPPFVPVPGCTYPPTLQP
eukprot:320552-Chlamydomonas_euryale.AAC.26